VELSHPDGETCYGYSGRWSNVDIGEVLTQVERDLATAEAELQRAEARAGEIRQIRHGLLLAQERYDPAGVAEPVVASTDDDVKPGSLNGNVTSAWQLLPLKDVVVTALREIGAAAETREVHDVVTSHMRDEKYESVRASLNYLKRLEKVVSLRPGLWALADPVDTPDPELPADNGAGRPLFGEGVGYEEGVVVGLPAAANSPREVP